MVVDIIYYKSSSGSNRNIFMCHMFSFRFIHVADDGHMRLRCCGKYVTGIGNVPTWEHPRKKPMADYHNSIMDGSHTD